VVAEFAQDVPGVMSLVDQKVAEVTDCDCLKRVGVNRMDRGLTMPLKSRPNGVRDCFVPRRNQVELSQNSFRGAVTTQNDRR
jgi:hypothetical protein